VPEGPALVRTVEGWPTVKLPVPAAEMVDSVDDLRGGWFERTILWLDDG
jgi:hypothetical protein